MQNRPLYTIAADIRSDWKKVNYAAVPYLDAMQQLNSIDDNFILSISETSQATGSFVMRLASQLERKYNAKVNTRRI